LTGGKETKKVEYRHSGYPGGLRESGYDQLLGERPVHVVERAVRGMLPKNSLGRAMFGKLSVYEGAEHPHAGQNPVPLKLGEMPVWDGLPAAPEPGKKATVRKPPASRAPAKPSAGRAAAKRSTAKRSASARAASKRAAAKPTTSKKPPAKKPASRRKRKV
jgi:hypothetical protein